MKFFRRHWYNIGLVVAIITLVYLLFSWHSILIVRRLILLNFVAILLHQFEEYGFPGGEPAIINMVIRPSQTPDRFPLNQNSAMVINVLASYTFYLIPFYFPDIVWLGLAPVLFGFSQFIVHGIITNLKLKSFYNPGLGAVVLLHIPIGVYYIYEIHLAGLDTIWNWVIGIIYMIAFTYISLVKMTYDWLSKKESPYYFSTSEMERFNVKAKLAKLHHIGS
jgi:Protein of unknown function with HXXEE motif